MYCDTCGKLLSMDMEEYAERATEHFTVECSSCRHTPEQATDLLEEFSSRQTMKI